MAMVMAVGATVAVGLHDSTVPFAHAGTGDQLWLVQNNTKDPIYGRWEVEQNGRSSFLEWSARAPLQPGQANSTVQHNPAIWDMHFPYWMGKLCFHKTYRGFPRTQAETLQFLLGNNGDDKLYVVYQESGGVRTKFLDDTHEAC
jgi:hypothetical protein